MAIGIAKSIVVKMMNEMNRLACDIIGLAPGGFSCDCEENDAGAQ